MSDVTVSFPAAFRKRDGSALVARSGPVAAAPAEASPTARLLALAYWLDRQVQTGALKDYRKAAVRLGVSHARVSQITGLLLVRPADQADVLLGRRCYAERTLQQLAAAPLWHAANNLAR